jgi:hypothetical protein
MSFLTNFSIATNAFLTSVRKSNNHPFTTGLLTIAVALPLAAGLAGCGGGGGGTGTPSGGTKEVSGTTPVTPVVTSPVNTGGTGSFVPNYRAELIAARRWDKSTLTVGFTAPTNANGTVRNVGPLVQQAIDLWNQKVGQNISFQLTSAADADIQIRWVPTASLPSDAIGRTEVRFRNADQVLISASVSVEQSLPDSFQVQVISHELGHSLGIEGHSTVQSDLMFTNAHLPVQITTRDQNTVLQAYATAANRSVQPAASDAGISAATSAVQYVCGPDESPEHTEHTAHSH